MQHANRYCLLQMVNLESIEKYILNCKRLLKFEKQKQNKKTSRNNNNKKKIGKTKQQQENKIKNKTNKEKKKTPWELG